MGIPYERKFTKKIDILPDWFNIENYTKSKDSNLLEWAHNIFIRANIIQKITNTLASKQDPKKLDVDTLALIDKIFSEGFLSETAFHEFSGNIELLTVEQVNEIYFYAYKLQKASAYPDEKLRAYVDELGLFHGDSFRHLRVDINAPTKFLIKEFDNWLKKEKEYFVRAKNRSKLSFNKEISSTTIRNWAHRQVLPYLDLVIWMTMEQKPLKIADKEQLLFPDFIIDEEGAEYKKTKKLALDLISYDYIEFIVNQVSRQTQLDFLETQKNLEPETKEGLNKAREKNLNNS